MKKLFLLFFATGLIFLISCGEGNIRVLVDPDIQRGEDIAIIEKFLADKGYTADQIDTTASGVRYVIIDEGQTQHDSLDIDESDIVDFNYIGRLTTDSLFDTSIESIAITDTLVYNELRNYAPFTVNYTETGWSLESSGFVQGFSDGITGTFGKMHVGGRALIVIPSDLGYGAVPQSSQGVETIPANSVITFELLPVAVIKQ